MRAASSARPRGLIGETNEPTVAENELLPTETKKTWRFVVCTSR